MPTRVWRIALTLAVFAALAGPGGVADAWPLPERLVEVGELTSAQRALMAQKGSSRAQIDYSLEARANCVGGFADIYPCRSVDLLAHMPLSEIGGGSGSDLWGWYDRQRRKDYGLFGRSNGVAVVDVSDPENPVYVANLPTQDRSSVWRDVKVYNDHAFVVADQAGDHGMQVFDLRQVRSITDPPQDLTPVALYDAIPSAHNIVVNEASGFAYAVGTDTCAGGLHMIDVRNPLAPSFAGCYAGDGYTHDAQCVIYKGPDLEYRRRELCFASNEDTLTVVDVTDKANPILVSRNTYAGSAYTHQGWLSKDQDFFVMGDELDERNFGHNTRTYFWDISDLENPFIATVFTADGMAVDHNQYVRGIHTYQANYQRGLRILRLSNPSAGVVSEVAYFDTYPQSDGNEFEGAWSTYPFSRQRIVLVSDINRGLFILKARILDIFGFEDDFESGALGRWEKRVGGAVEVVSPGLEGSAGALRVDLAAGERASYVAADHGPGEESFSASFLLAAGDARPAAGEIEILQLRDEREVIASLTVERRRGGGGWAHLYARRGGSFDHVGSARLPRRHPVRIGVEWSQASGAGQRDGKVSLERRDKRVGELADLDNSSTLINEVRIGLPSPSSGGAGSGALLIDDYVSSP